MAVDTNRVGILDSLIKQAGVPLISITFTDENANPPVTSLQYSPLVTAEQIALAEQIRDGFDWRRRRALPRLTVVAGFNSLTAGQRALIDAHQRAEYLRSNPDLAALISQATGVPLPVDEVDPT